MKTNTISEMMMHANDPTAIDLLTKAQSLSPAAQNEFVVAFRTGPEFVADGEIYVGGRRTAHIQFGHLIAEASAAGIRLAYRP